MNDPYVSAGPVSTMPGSTSNPLGHMCDDHPDRPALHRVQGETDSFGAEYMFVCAGCMDSMRALKQARLEMEMHCDWCKCMKKGCVPHRDFEEGMSGPVYIVCGDCRKKELDALADERRDAPDTQWDEVDLGWDGEDEEQLTPTTRLYHAEDVARRSNVAQPTQTRVIATAWPFPPGHPKANK